MKSILHEMKMSMRLFELTKAWEENKNVNKSMKAQDNFEKPDFIMNPKNEFPYQTKFVSFP